MATSVRNVLIAASLCVENGRRSIRRLLSNGFIIVIFSWKLVVPDSPKYTQSCTIHPSFVPLLTAEDLGLVRRLEVLLTEGVGVG